MRKNTSLWPPMLLGGLLGLLYVILDEGILDQTASEGLVTVVHEFLDMVLPILLGLAVGAGFYLYKRQTRLNRRLSLGNDRLKQELLFHAWISQILHEIQNPLHNLSALIEEGSGIPEPERQSAMIRNLDKLRTLKARYGKFAALGAVDPGEALSLKPWLDKLLDEKVYYQLAEAKTALTLDVEPVRVFMHPLFLEQILLGLFSNAMEAVEKIPDRWIRLSIRHDARTPSTLLLTMINPGQFPQQVIETQGSRPADSRHGMGLGLLLIRTIADQVGGGLSLSNRDGQACVEIRLQGERL